MSIDLYKQVPKTTQELREEGQATTTCNCCWVAIYAPARFISGVQLCESCYIAREVKRQPCLCGGKPIE